MAHTHAIWEINKSPIYSVYLASNKGITTHYFLIPKIKENNMDLELQGKLTVKHL